jgi:hypothetical protein
MLVFGLSMCFAPANVAAYLYTPPQLRGAAVGLLSLLRNEGGSVLMRPLRAGGTRATDELLASALSLNRT